MKNIRMRECLSSCIIKPSESTKHRAELQYNIQERTTLQCFQVNKIFAYDILNNTLFSFLQTGVYTSVGHKIFLEKYF